jgi:hypothetical protein
MLRLRHAILLSLYRRRVRHVVETPFQATGRPHIVFQLFSFQLSSVTASEKVT